MAMMRAAMTMMMGGGWPRDDSLAQGGPGALRVPPSCWCTESAPELWPPCPPHLFHYPLPPPPGLSAPLAVAPRLQTPIAPPLPLPPPSSPSPPPPHSAPLLPPSTVTSSSSLTSASASLITIFLSCMSFPISPSHSSSSFFPFPSSLFFLLCSPPPPHPLGRGACHEPELRGQPCSWQQQRPWR